MNEMDAMSLSGLGAKGTKHEKATQSIYINGMMRTNILTYTERSFAPPLTKHSDPQHWKLHYPMHPVKIYKITKCLLTDSTPRKQFFIH